MSMMNGTSMQALPMANAIPMGHPHLLNPNVKDSRWLTLEVCREFTRNKCTRSDQECKFAHPPPHVEVQNGRVTCCFDSIKGKCQRKDPPCKYLHPPQHLKEQLLQNGRNNLILRNLQMQAIAGGLQPVISGVVPTVMYEPTCSNKGVSPLSYSAVLPGTYPFATHPYLTAPNAAQAFNPYLQGLQTGVMPTMDQSGVSIPVSVSTGSQQIPGMIGATNPSALTTQKVARADRLESSTAVSASSGGVSSTWNGHPGATHGSPSDSMVSNSSPYNHPIYFQPSQMVEVLTNPSKKRPRDPADDLVLGISPGVHGMVPIVKRTAMDGKGGVPMYPATHGNTAAYQQALAAMQLQQQYVPVTIAGHPPSMPRF